MSRFPEIRSTTVLCVRRNGKVTMAGDGQVTMGSEVIKGMVDQNHVALFPQQAFASGLFLRR